MQEPTHAFNVLLTLLGSVCRGCQAMVLKGGLNVLYYS